MTYLERLLLLAQQAHKDDINNPMHVEEKCFDCQAIAYLKQNLEEAAQIESYVVLYTP